MAKVCLECATPKFTRKGVEKGLVHCNPCNKPTHTVDSTPRKPLCHDCKNFGIKCTDGVWRPALNYGPVYLEQASCTVGDGGILENIADFLGPKFAKYDYACPAFERHVRAPSGPSANPLTPQERKEWREYLEMPSAFWLEPRRWEGIIDTHKQMFWEKGEHKKSPVKAIAFGAAIVAGLFMAAKKTG